MANIAASNSNTSRSFLLWWIAANILGLPIIWGPMKLGQAILDYLGRLSNGKPIDGTEFILPIILLPLGGAVMGAWLGLVQWLVLRTKISPIGRWIWASSVAGLIGAPLSWVAFVIIGNSPLVHRPSGYYLSDWYSFISFGGMLGLSVGISQWVVLRRLGNRAVSWIFTLPICFTLGLAIAKFKLVPDTVVAQVCQLTQKLAPPFQSIMNNQIFALFAFVSIVIALVSIGLCTGVVLNWLLRWQSNLVEEQ